MFQNMVFGEIIMLALKYHECAGGNMAQGTVKWFNRIQGFGFIEQEDGEDLFVHKTQVEDEIEEGDTVEFEVGEGPKGPNAMNVKKV